MAKEELKSRTARVQLENGTDAQGNEQYVYVSLSRLSNSASDWDADKFLGIVQALSSCLNPTLASAQTIATYTVSVS